MQTLVVFSDYNTLPVFYLLEGDKRHWHGVIINHERSVTCWLSDEEYAEAEEEITMELFPLQLNGTQLPPHSTELGVLTTQANKNGGGMFYTATCGYAL